MSQKSAQVKHKENRVSADPVETFFLVEQLIETGVDPSSFENKNRVLKYRSARLRTISPEDVLEIDTLRLDWSDWKKHADPFSDQYYPTYQWRRKLVLDKDRKRLIVQEL